MSDKNEPLKAQRIKKCFHVLGRKNDFSFSFLRTRKTDFFVLLVQNSFKFNQEKATKPHSFQ